MKYEIRLMTSLKLFKAAWECQQTNVIKTSLKWALRRILVYDYESYQNQTPFKLT